VEILDRFAFQVLLPAAVFEKGASISDRVFWKLKGFEVFVEPVSEGQLDIVLRKHQGFCHHH